MFLFSSFRLLNCGWPDVFVLSFRILGSWMFGLFGFGVFDVFVVGLVLLMCCVCDGCWWCCFDV